MLTLRLHNPPVGYYAAGMANFIWGVGVAMGAMWSGGWGYNSGWGGNNNITINNNNNFVNNSNRQNINNGNRPANQPARGNSNWQHNPQHRGGAPYSDRAMANKYGGSARGDSMQNRQANARREEPGPAATGEEAAICPAVAQVPAPAPETRRTAALAALAALAIGMCRIVAAPVQAPAT